MTTRTSTNFGFLFACVFVFLVGLSSVVSITQLVESTDWSTHTQEVRNSLEKLSYVYMNAQNNIRGYFLTNQDPYRANHEKAKTDLFLVLNEIRKQVSDNLTQQEQLNKLETLLHQRISVWEESSADYKIRGIVAIRERMKTEVGKNLDRAIFEIINSMKLEEEGLYNTRSKQTHETAKVTIIIVIIGGLLALLFIVTAASLVNRDTKLRESAEAERDLFFSTSLDMLCISGMDGYFKKLNPAFEDTLGFTLKEMYSTSILDMIHPDDIQKTNEEIARQAQGYKVMSFENRFRTKAGDYRLFSWKSVPVGDRMYAVARDVTQQKIFEKELVEAQKLSQQADRAKSEFLANMSHEIRTPLNGIIGVTDLLMMTELNEEQKNFNNVIRNSGTLLLKIINEILDFSKIEAGKLELEHLDFNLVNLIDNQVSLVSGLIQEKNLTLKTSFDPRLPTTLFGDAGRIAQILLNLVANAIKFTEQGSIQITVDLVGEENSKYMLKFSIKDSGIGMTQEQSQKLFSPFIQADNSTARKYGGTGLGLSISKRLVEMMGGEINVVSQLGEGSTFWFTIRLKGSQLDEQIQSSLKDSERRQHERAEKTLRILVAEDNHVNQMIIIKMLERLGHSAHTVGNGKEAVEAFINGQYDIILMDHHMPEMDGVEATTLIRSHERNTNKRIPILAFTANVLEEDQRLCLRSGMDDLILKPVTITALQKSLNKHFY